MAPWPWSTPVSHHKDKMATVLADDNFKCIFLNENYRIPIQILLKFIPMAWLRIGEKPLPEIMVTQFTDAYMRH